MESSRSDMPSWSGSAPPADFGLRLLLGGGGEAPTGTALVSAAFLVDFEPKDMLRLMPPPVSLGLLLSRPKESRRTWLGLGGWGWGWGRGWGWGWG